MRKILISLVFMLGLVPAGAVAAENAKVGYVNLPYLMENSPQAEAADSRIQERFGPKQEELQAKQQEFQELQQKLQKEGLTSMSEQERQQAQERLRTLKREMQRMQQAVREDLNIERNKAFKDLREAAMQAVQKLAEEEGFDLVVGQGVLYASDRVDITQRVLERMKANYDGGGSGSE